ncbi:hypothetical protein D3C85_1459680 [compost metagenome]
MRGGGQAAVQQQAGRQHAVRQALAQFQQAGEHLAQRATEAAHRQAVAEQALDAVQQEFELHQRIARLRQAVLLPPCRAFLLLAFQPRRHRLAVAVAGGEQALALLRGQHVVALLQQQDAALVVDIDRQGLAEADEGGRQSGLGGIGHGNGTGDGIIQ